MFEIIKIFSPWLLALVVYLVWHWQKEKEVIANETKDILKLIDELKSSFASVYVQYHLYINNHKHFNEEYLKEVKGENYKISKDFLAKVKFLLTLIESKQVYELYKKIELNETKFSATQLMFGGEQEEVEFLKTLSRRIEKDLDELKVKLVGYAMYKNRIRSRRKLFGL
ncbi:MAG: hypothetical protein RRY99_15955 [Flavobacterium sp.]